MLSTKMKSQLTTKNMIDVIGNCGATGISGKRERERERKRKFDHAHYSAPICL